MRVLRILLQIVIVVAGGITFAAIISRTPLDVTGIAVLSGFIAFLLALTLALKEETQARTVLGYKLTYKPMGIVLLLLGAFGLLYGASILTGAEALPDGSGRCRVFCQIIVVATQYLGETFGRLLAFTSWCSIGSLLCYSGYKVINVKAT